MTTPLEFLVSSRQTRRERAIVESADAKRRFDAALADCERARAAMEQARVWRADVLSSCTLGERQDALESLLQSSDALLHRCRAQFEKGRTALRQAHAHLIEARRNLVNRERDSLRLDEWLLLEQSSTRRKQATRQDLADEELAPVRKSGRGTT